MASIPNTDGLDVGAVRLFLDVIELGSVSKAAVRHRLAQPSATARLQKLERQLGVQLLDRAPTGSVATAAGVRLAPACADVVAATGALLERAGAVAEERTRLVLAVTRHVADHFLPAWVDAAELDDVRLDLVEGDTLAVSHAVRAGEADLGCTDGPAAPLGLNAAVVDAEEVLAVVGRRHAWFGRRRPVSGEELVATTLVLPRAGSGTRDLVGSVMAPFEFGPVGDRLEVASSAGARVAALGGAAVAFLPRCRVAGDLAAGALRALDVRGVSIEQQVRAVWRGVRPPSGAARRMLTAMRRR